MCVVSLLGSVQQKLMILKWRLIPMLIILYLITYIDKTNIGKTAGLAFLLVFNRFTHGDRKRQNRGGFSPA